jgi:acyl carrier protein
MLWFEAILDNKHCFFEVTLIRRGHASVPIRGQSNRGPEEKDSIGIWFTRRSTDASGITFAKVMTIEKPRDWLPPPSSNTLDCYKCLGVEVERTITDNGPGSCFRSATNIAKQGVAACICELMLNQSGRWRQCNWMILNLTVEYGAAPLPLLEANNANCQPAHPLHSAQAKWRSVMSNTTTVGEGAMQVVRRMLFERSIDRPVSPDDNLADVGLTSLDIVELVMSVESEFDMSIPETHITPANFRSIAAIDALISSLRYQESS